MDTYKHFFLFLALLLPILLHAQPNSQGAKQRQYCVSVLTKIADPVLGALSRQQLKKSMPVESSGKSREYSTHLEAFGRLLAGMAPWLELGEDATPEGQLRKRYIALAHLAIHNATDPSSADFMNFNKGKQPLVDAAFFAEALLRSPTQLWAPLNSATKQNVISALKSTRVITPSYSNWLMFSAIIEAAILKFDSGADMMRIDYALKQHELWYKGDGMYGDGPEFHFDYYNSFVIQPMLLEVVQVMKEKLKRPADEKLLARLVARSRRYAAIQERLISPEGTFPPVGRSLAYRFGAFHLLSKMAALNELPQELKPQQVRAALCAIIRRQAEAPGTFDKDGWLQIGFAGYQPGIGESYVSTGSLYLCSQVFLILGLSPNDQFWQGDDLPWTAKKMYAGENMPLDHAWQEKEK